MSWQKEYLEAKELRDEYKKAERLALTSQSYEVDGRKLTRQNLKEIKQGIRENENKMQRALKKRTRGAKIFQVIPRG